LLTEYAERTQYATSGSALTEMRNPALHKAARLTAWDELAAAGVVLVVPALLATIVVQRGFVRGLTFGAVKQ
jgi:ABC-type glycerol-3-phosphate transport system permease component